MSLARRVATAEKQYAGNADADAVLRCADFLCFAFLPTPLYARRHGDGTQGFRSLIDCSGVRPDDVPRALVLALARNFGTDELRAAQVVLTMGS